MIGIDTKVEEARALVTETLKQSSDACLTCSFQAEDMVVLDMVRDLRPDIPVLFLETGYHFAEVYRYRDDMTMRYGLNLINLSAKQSVAEQEAQFGILNQTAPDRCCKLRKVEPLFAALQQYNTWFTGLRRVQSPTRANLQTSESFALPSGKVLTKVNALAHWSDQEVWAYARERDIALLSLYDAGYTSIGCEPCTALPLEPENHRSGRWAGRKLECGIHIAGR